MTTFRTLERMDRTRLTGPKDLVSGSLMYCTPLRRVQH